MSSELTFLGNIKAERERLNQAILIPWEFAKVTATPKSPPVNDEASLVFIE